MIVLSAAVVLALTPSYDSHFPIIGYQNLVTVSNIAATYADANYPVTNLANPQTFSLWMSTGTATQYLTVTLDGTIQTDYVGVARHNWGSGLVVVSIEAITADIGAVWTEVVAGQLLGDDLPALFLFTAGYYIGVRIKLVPAAVIPQAAVVYVGKSLQLQRGVQVGHTPLTFGLQQQLIAGSSMNGEFLGEIELSRTRSSTVGLKNFEPVWYRANMQPFVDVARTPFFFAWAPLDYPAEVGYARCSANPVPVISQRPGYIDVTLSLDGLGY